VTEVAEHTGFPEMLDGRVKTLHPRIHGGLLARRDLPAHMEALQAHGIATIDLLVVNLYPFAQATAPSRLHAGRRDREHRHRRPGHAARGGEELADVAVLIDPADYEGVLAELQAGGISQATKFALSVEGQRAQRLRRHDQQLPVALAAGADGRAAPSRRDRLPGGLRCSQDAGPALRREPAPGAAFYRDLHPAPGLLAGWTQLQGKELSYNNIADADAAWECVKTFDTPACVIVKHANPCGVAVGATRWSRPTARPGRPTRPRPSAASSPSTGRWTKPPHSRSAKTSSSSRC
jgi:phosphoribosylaminoimidazolecarboxamide formyltransferase/IMP cyclohydrolase